MCVCVFIRNLNDVAKYRASQIITGLDLFKIFVNYNIGCEPQALFVFLQEWTKNTRQICMFEFHPISVLIICQVYYNALNSHRRAIYSETTTFIENRLETFEFHKNDEKLRKSCSLYCTHLRQGHVVNSEFIGGTQVSNLIEIEKQYTSDQKEIWYTIPDYNSNIVYQHLNYAIKQSNQHDEIKAMFLLQAFLRITIVIKDELDIIAQMQKWITDELQFEFEIEPMNIFLLSRIYVYGKMLNLCFFTITAFLDGKHQIQYKDLKSEEKDPYVLLFNKAVVNWYDYLNGFVFFCLHQQKRLFLIAKENNVSNILDYAKQCHFLSCLTFKPEVNLKYYIGVWKELVDSKKRGLVRKIRSCFYVWKLKTRCHKRQKVFQQQITITWKQHVCRNQYLKRRYLQKWLQFLHRKKMIQSNISMTWKQHVFKNQYLKRQYFQKWVQYIRHKKMIQSNIKNGFYATLQIFQIFKTKCFLWKSETITHHRSQLKILKKQTIKMRKKHQRDEQTRILNLTTKCLLKWKTFAWKQRFFRKLTCLKRKQYLMSKYFQIWKCRAMLRICEQKKKTVCVRKCLLKWKFQVLQNQSRYLTMERVLLNYYGYLLREFYQQCTEYMRQIHIEPKPCGRCHQESKKCQCIYQKYLTFSFLFSYYSELVYETSSSTQTLFDLLSHIKTLRAVSLVKTFQGLKHFEMFVGGACEIVLQIDECCERIRKSLIFVTKLCPKKNQSTHIQNVLSKTSFYSKNQAFHFSEKRNMTNIFGSFQIINTADAIRLWMNKVLEQIPLKHKTYIGFFEIINQVCQISLITENNNTS